ncbi:hypothetical protein HNR26_000056 [Rhizobium rosettiformans]|uniref:Uncharacterized protein n=2 Tax=Rhizobium rosettiformans TaxID=1368430 RepID=A0A4S8Q6P4_9HYPH|nr:hypothetical protein [Rhizobium rosettiformans]MBB5274018.1 hypothetical protein [Rhizobium rosettiformans]THV38315.1 hypothetical protein FAA86_05870 [Rhizobium rosettiformans W3]
MTMLFNDSVSLAPARDFAVTEAKTRRLLIVGIGLQLALALPSLLALFIDERVLNDISVWVKPLKFQASLPLMLVTLLLLLPLIELRMRAGRGVWLASLVAVITASGEILYITLQAARGRASHFNDSTPFEATAYSVMGAGAALLVLSSLVIGLYILRRPSPDAPAGLRLGAGWGLVLGSVATLITAFALGSGEIGGPGHWVGGARTDLGGLPLVGWSRTGGDLRVPHFFATHIMQALPLLGLAFDRVAPRFARSGIAFGAVLSIAVVIATFVQAVQGQPFL